MSHGFSDGFSPRLEHCRISKQMGHGFMYLFKFESMSSYDTVLSWTGFTSVCQL